MRRGEQKCIPTPGQQASTHVFGAWDWHSDEIIWTVSAEKNSDAFIIFIEHLLVHHYPDERIVLVMDNASFHHSYRSRAALSLFDDRLLLFWLPPYCSVDLNPIERYWKHLKQQVCVNVLYPSLSELTQSVESELERQNKNDYSERFLFSK